MTTERDVYEIDASDAVQALEDVGEAQGKVAEQTKTVSDLFKKDLHDSFMTAQAAYDGLKTVAGAVVDVLKDSVAAALDAEQTDRRLAAALKNAGYEAEAWMDTLSNQAAAMERLTGKDDEYYKGLQTLLLTFGVAPEQVGRFTQAALDLSVAMGTDATQAARLLARAHSEGKDEIKKYGINVDEAAFKARGFAAVLDEAERAVGGLSGQMPEQVRAVHELRGAWESLKESIGGTVINSHAFVAGAGLLTMALDGLSEIISGKQTDALVAYDKAVGDSTTLTEQYHAQVLEGRKRLDEYNTATKTGAWNTELYRRRLEEIKEIIANTAAEQNKLNTGLKLDADPLTPRVRAPVIELEGGEERAKKLAKWDAEYKKRLEENEKLFVMSKSNLLKAEKEADAAHEAQVRESVLKAGDWEEAQAEEYKAQQAGIYQFNHDLATREEEERQARRDAEVAKEKAFYDNLLNEAASYGRKLLDFLGDLVVEQLTQSKTYNDAYKKALIERRMLDSEAAGAKKTHLEVEQELQAEAQAAQEKRTAEFLAGIAKEAGVKAVLEGVEAVASLARYDYPAAAQHGVAAAGYAGVALIAGGAAAAISGSRGMTAEEKASIDSLNRRDKDRSERAAQTTDAGSSVQTTQNVYFFGISGMNDLQQAAELDRLKRNYDRLSTGA